MADRMSIAMLIGPIKKDFGIGDFQASLLVGAAFTSFYVLFLIPIGFAADRFSRRKVLAICLFLRSLAAG
jgi:MFS family permease